MSTRYAIFYVAALSALSLCACAHEPNKAATGAHPTASTQDAITIEDLLRWPLQGPQGTQRTREALSKLFVLKQLRANQYSGDGPIRLADGHTLSFVWLGPGQANIDLGIEQEPCFSAERAAKMINAVVSPVTEDMHGVDHGKTYDAVANGVRVRFTSTPVTYLCVKGIHVSLVQGRP